MTVHLTMKGNCQQTVSLSGKQTTSTMTCACSFPPPKTKSSARFRGNRRLKNTNRLSVTETDEVLYNGTLESIDPALSGVVFNQTPSSDSSS
jgi:hypothetical protein